MRLRSVLSPLSNIPVGRPAETRVWAHVLIDDRIFQMAIATKAKQFVAAPLVQTVVNDVYSGKVVFSNVATARSILADNYKPKAIAVYDHRTAPFLDHYRWVALNWKKLGT